MGYLTSPFSYLCLPNNTLDFSLYKQTPEKCTNEEKRRPCTPYFPTISTSTTRVVVPYAPPPSLSA
jgi:hypothetical protein